jgi:hypothetical protein
MSTFVLVHGAWHDGSAWEPVIKHLEAQGHQAFAPTIAGTAVRRILDPQKLNPTSKIRDGSSATLINASLLW